MSQADIHEPVRMCVVCRERFPKGELARYVRPEDAIKSDESPIYDPEKDKPGRGYYVCGQARCRERFPKMVMGLMKKRRGD
ncbi:MULTISPECIES: DUF448 domain-containing protein [unclassified Pseudodesulfovibrio]|uniref:YlxR family protein n=1 Tax=unclassified Pseudodesulfovibrio TaxID=2661612 RepID=UPI000FEC05D5|nr:MULTISPECIES: DUF448 domain-containing protein [unclassified Pseudodesulfovibrio]MCJ2163175.1 DUF448 domain-containing protein [Pseudodesulfovibrio sp. S3-i]RWU07164.1 DUF448 domain-containing protein [Pseudodesulfovibrio sp. S3]